MSRTKIEWCARPETVPMSWNVTVGCSKISSGCTHCFAERMALRLAHMALADIEKGNDPGRKRHYLDVVDLERRCWNGQVKLVPEALEDPTHWKKPRTVFVDSMSDLFHAGVPDDFICDVFYKTAWATDHTFIILTKRAQRMYEWFNHPEVQNSKWHHSLPNVIGMVTIENQEQADKRIPWLLNCPFSNYGVSIEPMLEGIKLPDAHVLGMHHQLATGHQVVFGSAYGKRAECLQCRRIWQGLGGLSWVIAGAETGPGRREMNADWARDVRDQCREASTPFFFKRMGNGPTPEDLQIREWPGG